MEALVLAAGPRLRVNDSGAPRDERAPPTPSTLERPEKPQGVLTSSDWAAALRAAYPDAVDRGKCVLSLVKAIDADIGDLVLSKVRVGCCWRGTSLISLRSLCLTTGHVRERLPYSRCW